MINREQFYVRSFLRDYYTVMRVEDPTNDPYQYTRLNDELFSSTISDNLTEDEWTVGLFRRIYEIKKFAIEHSGTEDVTKQLARFYIEMFGNQKNTSFLDSQNRIREIWRKALVRDLLRDPLSVKNLDN